MQNRDLFVVHVLLRSICMTGLWLIMILVLVIFWPFFHFYSHQDQEWNDVETLHATSLRWYHDFHYVYSNGQIY